MKREQIYKMADIVKSIKNKRERIQMTALLGSACALSNKKFDWERWNNYINEKGGE